MVALKATAAVPIHTVAITMTAAASIAAMAAVNGVTAMGVAAIAMTAAAARMAIAAVKMPAVAVAMAAAAGAVVATAVAGMSAVMLAAKTAVARTALAETPSGEALLDSMEAAAAALAATCPRWLDGLQRRWRPRWERQRHERCARSGCLDLRRRGPRWPW